MSSLRFSIKYKFKENFRLVFYLAGKSFELPTK